MRVPQKRTSHLPIQPYISCATDTITGKSLSILEISSNLSMLLLSSPCGAMVQRLARGPFKAEMRVRFPLALPNLPLLFSNRYTNSGTGCGACDAP